MPETNARFLGTIPELYDRHLGSVIFEPYAADMARRVTLAVTGPVLEVACGTGILTQQLRTQLPPSTQLVATDLNQPMIDHARTKLAALEHIDWHPADAAVLPFAPASFAALVCQFGLMFVPDKEAAFREARRVLTHGGLLAFSVWDSFEHNAIGRIAHETIGSFFSVEPPNFYQVPFGFHDPDVLRHLLEENDFGQIELEWVTLEALSPSAKSFALGLVKGNPVSIAIQERGLALDPIVEAVEAALVRLGGNSPFRSSMRALVVTARAGIV
ncbi:MAG: class I SAM-dependent methyltransferase [Thiobacillaceae bacterium]